MGQRQRQGGAPGGRGQQDLGGQVVGGAFERGPAVEQRRHQGKDDDRPGVAAQQASAGEESVPVATSAMAASHRSANPGSSSEAVATRWPKSHTWKPTRPATAAAAAQAMGERCFLDPAGDMGNDYSRAAATRGSNVGREWPSCHRPHSSPRPSGRSGSTSRSGVILIVVAVRSRGLADPRRLGPGRARGRSRAPALGHLLPGHPPLPAPDRRPGPHRDPAPARGAAQRAPVQLRERGDPRAEDAGGLAAGSTSTPCRCATCRRAGARTSTAPCARTSTACTHHQQRPERRHVHGPAGGGPPAPGLRPARAAGHRPDPHPPPARARGVRYEGPETLRLRGDAEALETAVLNLLDNAVKYSKDQVAGGGGGRRATGTARPTCACGTTGIGMSRAHLRFIFNRFYRIGAEVRRSHTGTGLGPLHRAVGGEGPPGHRVRGQRGPGQRLDLHRDPARRDRAAADAEDACRAMASGS